MRIDLPPCDFNNCILYSDSNCRSLNDYRKCKYAIKKSMLNSYIESEDWELFSLPLELGTYQVMIFNIVTNKTFRSVSYYNGDVFEVNNNNMVVAWLRV